MRILKIAVAGLLTALAMLVSLMVALGVAIVGLMAYLYLRLRGRSFPGPFQRPSTSPRSPPTGSDVIDVTATEVRTDRQER